MTREAAALLFFEDLVPDEAGRVHVRGHCMRPLINDGDEVRITTLDGDPEIGRVVLAMAENGEVVCHRMLGPGGRGRVLLAGDRGEPREHLSDQVLGVCAEVHRGGRSLTFGPEVLAVDRLLGRWHHLTWRLRRRSRWLAPLVDQPRRVVAFGRSLTWLSSALVAEIQSPPR